MRKTPEVQVGRGIFESNVLQSLVSAESKCAAGLIGTATTQAKGLLYMGFLGALGGAMRAAIGGEGTVAIMRGVADLIERMDEL